jgi:hypothetical protein
MLRFQPASWLEGLLRPLTLLDPNGYVYVEFLAPDLRFAALLVLSLSALAMPRTRRFLSRPAWGTLAALWLAFFVWTFVIGNGRYLVAGLLVVGPLVVMLVRVMPFTASMRMTTLMALFGLQFFLVTQTFQHQVWALATWTDGPGLPLARDEAVVLRAKPATFVTISNISHSLLVPQFHPASTWVNLFGQVDLHPGLPEYTRWRRMMVVAQPRYVVLQIVRSRKLTQNEQPPPEEAAMVSSSLALYGLRRTGDLCEVVRSHWTVSGAGPSDPTTVHLAYWFCPIELGGSDTLPSVAPENPAREVVATLERLCPKYLPPGGGKATLVGDMVLVDYRDTDMRLYIESTGGVYYRHMRSLNPTRLGEAGEFRSGRAHVECDKLEGRYVLPWQRD